jgi:hypothetical protein
MDIPANMPFTAHERDDRLVITLHGDAGQHPMMVQEASYRWIVAARGTIELDFSDIALVSSQLIAWLFHLIQAGRLSSLVVSKANRSVLKQLKQVYLDRFVTISYT